MEKLRLKGFQEISFEKLKQSLGPDGACHQSITWSFQVEINRLWKFEFELQRILSDKN